MAKRALGLLLRFSYLAQDTQANLQAIFHKLGCDAAICNKQQGEGLAARKNALCQAVEPGEVLQ